MQRLSGIATITGKFVEALKPFSTILLDTRKTTPGMRYLEKKAVRDGGGQNHRFNLAEMAMVKDNHIRMAGSITKAVTSIRNYNTHVKIEVEVKNLEELREAQEMEVDMIMLDNFGSELLKEAIAIKNNRSKFEVSGNVNLDNISQKALPGIDYISVGAITHSFSSLDISLNIRR